MVSIKEGNDRKAPSSMPLEFAPSSSKVVAIRKPVEVPLPANTEELRKPMSLLKVAWQACSLKDGNRQVLAGMDHSIWESFLGFLRGEQIRGYASRANVGLRWSICWSMKGKSRSPRRAP